MFCWGFGLLGVRLREQCDRIVAARLMDEAVAPHVEIPLEPDVAASDERQAYGFQTWLFSFPADGKTVTLIELSGNGGQEVYIDRARQLMIVITAGNYDRHDLKKSPIDIYFDIVEPAVLDP